MSKPVKELLRNEIVRRLDGVSSLAVVGFTGLDAVATNRVRGHLREKDIRMMVVKNSLARQAFRQIGLEVVGDLLDGPCAVAYGADSVVTVVRELLTLGKEAPTLKVKAAVLEGEAFGESEIDALSKYPTQDEAIARAVSCVLSPGANLAGCLIGPGSTIASLVKADQDKLEKAEAPAGDGDQGAAA